MKVSGEYTFDVAPEDVWEGLMDPEVLAATMPGCEKLELVGENQYEGELNIKVGPVQGKFTGRIELENINPPSSYDMKVDGQGAQGFVKATARVAIKPAEGKTHMSYEGDAQIGGRIASVGQRLLDSSAKAIIKQSLAGLNDVLNPTDESAPESGVASGVATDSHSAAMSEARPKKLAPGSAAPSQTEFAAKVAKEVAKDLVPKPVWITILAALALLALYFILR